MSNFKIFLVIDILKSNAVHAIKGDRKNYKPLKSPFFDTNDPIEIIREIKKRYDLKHFYIADLDAILTHQPNFQMIKKIFELKKLKIILDPGIRGVNDLELFSKYKIDCLILGLETIQNIKVIKKALKIFNKKNIIISLDMYKENILTNIKKLKKLNPLDVVEKLEKLGIKNIILLDLFKVGQKIGGIPPLYIKIKKNFSGNLLVGGGIKNFNDVLSYYDNNFSGVLIGTAIYDGTIKFNDLKTLIKLNQ